MSASWQCVLVQMQEITRSHSMWSRTWFRNLVSTPNHHPPFWLYLTDMAPGPSLAEQGDGNIGRPSQPNKWQRANGLRSALWSGLPLYKGVKHGTFSFHVFFSSSLVLANASDFRKTSGLLAMPS